MLLPLFEYLSEFFGPFRVVEFLSTRAILATLTSLFFSLVLGPKFINKMKKITKKKNENVKLNHDGKAAPYGSGYEKVEEKKWSQKYKKSIDCSNPKGFSQKAHCAGKKKKSENVMKLTKSKLKEMIEEEYFNYLVEKNVPTQPAKWSYYKSQAKKKFDVYPSAYANAWAAKMYKKAGGRRKKGK